MIDILLGTYNGENYVLELLRSLEAQTFNDWRLIVRDDGSTDETVSIIRNWSEETNLDVLFIDTNSEQSGASANFGALFEASDAPYFAFCDQDDVWLPGKLETMLAAVRQVEAIHGTDHPALAHSDLEVVNAELNTISPSYWKLLRYDAVNPAEKRSGLLENFVTGCATLGNRSLREHASPIPPEAMMHDWWVALTALWFGTLLPLQQATIRYRQHGKNVVGASDWGPFGLAARFVKMPGNSIERTKRSVRRTQIQARAFAEHNQEYLDESDFDIATAYCQVSGQSWFARKTFMIRHQFFASSPARTLFYWLVM